jgi:two-component system CheB/CheR fusion protein
MVMNDTNGANNAPSHVIGIGASAGGLEALQAFFSGLRNDSGAAYVVVQHLSPDYKSMMSELLAKHTEMTIFEVQDSIAVEANCIYLMPPRKNMLITEGKLLLSDQMPDGRPHMSIDVFLRSLAEDQQHRGIGIVLSGTGTDGTRGIRAMKETGGLVVVQKPDSAKFDGMPKNAFDTGLADMVLAPEKMGEALINFIRHPSITGDTPVIQYANSEESNDVLNEIFNLLKEKSSINFSQYKPTTVARRIERRLGINQLTTLDDYLKLLIKSPRELQILSKELLIGVTRFFRDGEAFERLKELSVKRLVSNREEKDAVRVWIAGCSSGEEAYSIAIMLNEAMEKENSKREIKIFATDVDEDAITEASTGTYSHEIVQDIPEHLLEKYFILSNGAYTVKNYLRQMVIFAVHNMIEDPPFSNVSLVSCRRKKRC